MIKYLLSSLKHLFFNKKLVFRPTTVEKKNVFHIDLLFWIYMYQIFKLFINISQVRIEFK